MLRSGGFAIDNKSISRKHLTISIAQVEPGDGVRRPYLRYFS